MVEPEAKSTMALGEKLEELDSLLSPADNPAAIAKEAREARHRQIPILDELITPADFEESLPVLEETVGDRNECQDVADKLEQKLGRELDRLVQVLKENLKQRIAKEVKSELDNRQKAK